MRRYFDIKNKEEQIKKEIRDTVHAVAIKHNSILSVMFYSTSICISSEHFMTTIHEDGETVLDSLCGGSLPATLEAKIAAVTEMHEAEQQHTMVIDAILKAV